MTLWTKAVVAICVVLVTELGVGAVGTPISAGEDSGAFAVIEVARLSMLFWSVAN
jgi:hypothetical protein